jgi:hypothetical protein
LIVFDFVADPATPAEYPVTDTDFKVGDHAFHPEWPGWIWKYVKPHNNPRVGWWELIFVLEGAKWPRPYGIPEIGDLNEMGYATLDHISEMEVLAKAAL